LAGYATAPDDTAAWQKFLDCCIANQLPIVSDRQIISKITNTLSILPTGNIAIPYLGSQISLTIDLGNVIFIYGGTRDRVVLDIGSASAQIREAHIALPAVFAYGAPSWRSLADLLDSPASTADDGIRLRHVHLSTVIEREVNGFSRGIAYNGCSYNLVLGGHHLDNRLARVWATEGANHDASFTNENTVIGGRMSCSGNANSLGDAYGDVFTWDKVSSNRGLNSNRFIGVTYEMSDPAGATYRVPILMDGAGGFCAWENCRQETNKGPFAICDGGLLSGAGTAYASNNRFGILFNSSTSDNKRRLYQVNGAYANIYAGPGAGEFHWNSGPIGALVTSNGAAGTAYIGGLLAFLDIAGTGPAKTLGGALAATARKGVHLTAAGVVAGLDTALTKTFRISVSAVPNFAGRLVVLPFNSVGARLNGNATDETWGNEPYVKGYGLASSNSFGNGYVAGADNQAPDITITVRDEVKSIYVGFVGVDHPLGLQAISIIGYQTPDCATGDSLYGGLRILHVMDDNGSVPLATAKPDTAGTHGFYQKGQRVANSGAAAGQTTGWQVSTTGWLAAAWAGSTAYPVIGRIVTNDSGKMYELKTAGTSGGPAGTGTAITDGTCVWAYIGGKAAFVTEAVSS